jgi:phosphonate transport system substrate-binding protein
MIEFLRQGKVDLVSESAFSAVLYERAVDANILLRQWKGGRASYQTLFFARKHSGIHRIDDLAGKLIAFEDEGSTSGYFVPKATIVDHDIVLKPVDQPRRVNDVGYIFAESEVNVVAWVARGKVDAGVLSDVHWVNESRAPLALKKQLHVFHTTPEIVRSVLIAGPELSGERLDGVVDILLDMSENDDGRAVLKAFYKTDRFDRLVGEAKASLDHIRRLFDRLEAPPS